MKSMWIDLIIMIAVFALMASCTVDIPERQNTRGFITYEIEGDYMTLVIHSDEPSVTLRRTMDGEVSEKEVYQQFYGCLTIGIRSGMVVEVWGDGKYWNIKI